MLGSPAAAEDATQDAFLSAFRDIASLQGRQLPRLADAHRRQRLHRRAAAPRPPPGDLARCAAARHRRRRSTSPTRRRARSRRRCAASSRRASRRRCCSCPHDQRLAVIMCDIQGFAYEEIAEAMRTSDRHREVAHRARPREAAARARRPAGGTNRRCVTSYDCCRVSVRHGSGGLCEEAVRTCPADVIDRTSIALSASLDGQLAPAAAATLEAHLATCATCRARLGGAARRPGERCGAAPALESPRSFRLTPAMAATTPRRSASRGRLPCGWRRPSAPRPS